MSEDGELGILGGSICYQEWLGDWENRFWLRGICAPEILFWELVPTVGTSFKRWDLAEDEQMVGRFCSERINAGLSGVDDF